MVKKGGEMIVFGILRRRRGKPRWADDPAVEKEKTTEAEEEHRMAGGEGGACPIHKLRNNKRQSLGLECSMFVVGIPPPHNSDKPQGLVVSNKNNIYQILTKNYF